MNLNLQEILPPAPKPKMKPIIEKPIIKKPIKPKPKPKKMPIKKKESKTQATKNLKENNNTKIKPKMIKKKPKPTPKPKKKKIIKKKKVQPKPKPKNNSFSNMLMGSGTSMYTTKPQQTSAPSSQSQKKINKLYGSEFNTYSPTQKEYIKHNLDHVQRITQNTLTRNGYPETARRTKQLGTNIVSFYLHPNGDISGLHLKHRIGYASLDENTIKVIRIAYKDYPLPNEKTRLIFYVKYTLY